MVRTLEASGFHWLGLNAKGHHIAVVGGQRVGFIAMCAGHGQCIQSSAAPFAPIKYTSKVATFMVNNVKDVSDFSAVSLLFNCNDVLLYLLYIPRNPIAMLFLYFL